MKLKLLVIKTHQLDVMKDFYSFLGMNFVEEQHGNGPVHYAAEFNEMVLEIYPLSEDALVDSSTRLGFEVNDLDSVLTGMKSQGFAANAKAKQTAWGYRSIVQDPDGRKVELYGASGDSSA